MRNEKIRIMFVCHGNICRSPMAEFVLKDMVVKKGCQDSFLIASSATSTEEIGNPVHHGTRNKLKQYGISVSGKVAIQLTKEDYDHYDYLLAMDSHNLLNMQHLLGNDPASKVCRLLDFTSDPRNIADPWYTGDFDSTYQDVFEGCEALLSAVLP